MEDDLNPVDYGVYLEIDKLIKDLKPKKDLIERLVFELLGKLDLVDRTTLAFEVYTADFTESKPERVEETEEIKALLRQNGISLPDSDETDEVPVSCVKGGGSQALRFWELELGDVFVCVPGPRDKYGNGGFRHTMNIYRKIKNCKVNNLLDINEAFNASRVTDGREFTIFPTSWVLRIAYDNSQTEK